jgi:hypothetical protein
MLSCIATIKPIADTVAKPHNEGLCQKYEPKPKRMVQAVRKIKIGKMSIPERGSVVCLNDTDVDCSHVVSNNDNILSSNDVLEIFN